jgi:uncharacterized protein
MGGKKVGGAFLILLLLICGFIPAFYAKATAAEPIPPRPATISYVYDYADLIDSHDKENIIKIARAIDLKTKAQIVVVTVNNLDGMALEEYSLKLLRSWGIGDREKNNGVLLLVNKENLLAGKSGRIRVEVGYGLEGTINDGKAGAILDTFALPAFKEGEYSKGIYDTFMAIAFEVAKEYGLDLSNGELSQLEDYYMEEEDGILFDVLLWIVVFIIIIFFLIPGRRGRRYRGGPFGGPFFGPFDEGGGFWGGFGGGSGGGFGGGGFGGGSGGGGGASR